MKQWYTFYFDYMKDLGVKDNLVKFGVISLHIFQNPKKTHDFRRLTNSSHVHAIRSSGRCRKTSGMSSHVRLDHRYRARINDLSAWWEDVA